MSKFHIHPVTGNAELCRAKIECPFGAAEEHYNTKKEARQAFELQMKTIYSKEAVNVDSCERIILSSFIDRDLDICVKHIMSLEDENRTRIFRGKSYPEIKTIISSLHDKIYDLTCKNEKFERDNNNKIGYDLYAVKTNKKIELKVGYGTTSAGIGLSTFSNFASFSSINKLRNGAKRRRQLFLKNPIYAKEEFYNVLNDVRDSVIGTSLTEYNNRALSLLVCGVSREKEIVKLVKDENLKIEEYTTVFAKNARSGCVWGSQLNPEFNKDRRWSISSPDIKKENNRLNFVFDSDDYTIKMILNQKNSYKLKKFGKILKVGYEYGLGALSFNVWVDKK